MTAPPSIAFAPIEDGDVEAVVELWTRCGLLRPQNDPHRDIAFARAGPASAVLVGRCDGRIVASVMVGHDGHRGVVYYLSVDPDRQGEGLGRATVAAAEAWLAERGVWKLNLMIRDDNARVRGFYEAIGYETEPRIVMSRRLVPSRPPKRR